ncbi:hypothetical protein [Halegenticoccus tardaugens]|uniref:hypothetical protein n=1 Tax=Halegenticoccus tardaugens TaxID=2071624 RepID=UPI00100B5795|nr:hypothetical protein [Halegenticoccus tardaugens]
MSHSPERPVEYVCENCHVIYAGTVIRTDEGHRYEPPDECAVCGAREFVELTQYPHVDSHAT